MAKEPWVEVGIQRLEELTWELFRLHDLNGDDLLEESELITLNEKIAILHHGKDTDTAEVRCKYRDLFRAKFDPEGRPVPYPVFRTYAKELLNGLDTDPEAQEMILEQFVAEARSGRQAFDMDVLSAFEAKSHCPTLDNIHGPSVSGESWLPERESISPLVLVQPQPLMLAPHPLKPKEGESDDPADDSLQNTSTGSCHLGDTGILTERDSTGSQCGVTADSSVGSATTANTAHCLQETPAVVVPSPPPENAGNVQRQQLSQAEPAGAETAMAGMPGGEAEPVAIATAAATTLATSAAAVAPACAEHRKVASPQRKQPQQQQQQQKDEQDDAMSSDVEWSDFRAAVASEDLPSARFLPIEKLIVERRNVRRSSSAPPAKKRVASAVLLDSPVIGRKAEASLSTGREATVG